jgi:hypothetical protein
MPNKITKANGHIVQSDWGQNDPTKMDYIHNKPNNLVFFNGEGAENVVDVDKRKFIFNNDIIDVEDNVIFIAESPIQFLAINCLKNNSISHFVFTIADKDEDDKQLDYKIELVGDVRYIGKAPDFKNGETWELSIYNGVVVGGKVE